MGMLRKLFCYFILKSSVRQRKKKKSYRNAFHNTGNVFALMPTNKDDLMGALSIVKSLIESGKRVTVFFHERDKDLVSDLRGVSFELYNDKDISNFNLPALPLRQRLKILTFDVVIDLNREYNLFCSICSNLVHSDTIVSFNKTDSDKFYNLQFSIPESRADVSYKNFLNCLQMF